MQALNEVFWYSPTWLQICRRLFPPFKFPKCVHLKYNLNTIYTLIVKFLVLCFLIQTQLSHVLIVVCNHCFLFYVQFFSIIWVIWCRYTVDCSLFLHGFFYTWSMQSHSTNHTWILTSIVLFVIRFTSYALGISCLGISCFWCRSRYWICILRVLSQV